MSDEHDGPGDEAGEGCFDVSGHTVDVDRRLRVIQVRSKTSCRESPVLAQYSFDEVARVVVAVGEGRGFEGRSPAGQHGVCIELSNGTAVSLGTRGGRAAALDAGRHVARMMGRAVELIPEELGTRFAAGWGPLLVPRLDEAPPAAEAAGYRFIQAWKKPAR